MFEQAVINVVDEPGYAQLHARIDAAFDGRDVEIFLNRVSRAHLRIRDYEAVMGRGLLGKDAEALYKALPISDQALTRERYLSLVEAVDPGLRQRYLKVYAYY
jgi:hypothetical protein